MLNPDLLQEYTDSIKRLQQQCKEDGMTEEEFKRLYFESLKSLEENKFNIPRLRNYFRQILLFIAILLLFLLFVFNYKYILRCFQCNIQEYIYPGLRFLRKLSIPLISLFPSLTEMYHETCIIQNPFFTVVDMDCWPCSTVTSISQIYNPKPILHQNAAPFIYETTQKPLGFGAIIFLYKHNKLVFDTESSKLHINNKFYLKASDIFNDENEILNNNLLIWRFNTMNTARVLRQLIPRPQVVPRFGQSTERFIIIDSSQSSFSIPDTECNFSFLLFLKGSRKIILKPAKECVHECKVLQVELKESYLLWYNWWYWRPVVQLSRGNSTLVAHVGSYCL